MAGEKLHVFCIVVRDTFCICGSGVALDDVVTFSKRMTSGRTGV